MTPRKLDWTNILFIGLAHAIAAFAVIYMAAIHFSWWTLGLGLLWYYATGLALTGGYHRLFAHPSYKATLPLRLFYLAFGAACVQNSALKWSDDHRIHHARTDSDEDPYDIRRGFLWAHIVWVLFEDTKTSLDHVKDLERDPFVMFQHRHYLAIAMLVGVVAPAGLGMLWGDPVGAVLVAGFLRVVVQWHATFSINSIAHMIGTRPYDSQTSARDSLWTGFITLGEGYHNFHHKFQLDYRNGIRWFHLDPTKWFVWTLSKVGVTKDLHRTRADVIKKARQEVLDRAA